MRFTRRLVIAVSMMVVVSAVAHKSAKAQLSPDSFRPSETPAPARQTETVAPAPVKPAETAAPAPVKKTETVTPASVSQPVTAVQAQDTGYESTPTADDEDTNKPRRKVKKASAAGQGALPSQDYQHERIFGGPARAEHTYQTGLSLMPGTGYRVVVPYQDGQFCGDASGVNNKRVCAHAVPAFLDIQLSFGVATRADLILDLRFGLQSDPAITGGHQFAVAPGLRFWIDQEIALKFYTTLQFVYDYMDFKASGPNNSDMGVRNANGLMYDPIRNVGFFVQFGETIGFMRWFHIDMDVGAGVQIRFP